MREDYQWLGRGKQASPGQLRSIVKQHLQDIPWREVDFLVYTPVGVREMLFHRETSGLLYDPSLVLGPDITKFYRSWSPNVTLLSEEFIRWLSCIEFSYHALDHVGSLIFMNLDIVERGHMTFFEQASLFFGGAARGLYYLNPHQGSSSSGSSKVEGNGRTITRGTAGNLKVKLSLGDVHDVVADEGQLWDRIMLSNIPDYTTMLPSFLYLLPHLRPPPSKKGLRRHNPTIIHRVLLATPRFTGLQAYVHRSLGLDSIQDSLPFLGGKHQSGDVWNYRCTWQNLAAPGKGLEHSQLSTPAKLEHWLR